VWRPRGARFNVTAKDETLDQDYISPVHLPLTLLWLVALSGVIAFGIRWIAFPGDHPVLSVVGGWAVFNFILVSVAWRAIGERQQRRASPRVEMDVAATVWLGGAESVQVPARIIDASTSGVRLLFSDGAERRLTENVESMRGQKLHFRPSFPDTTHLEATIRATVMSTRAGAGGLVCGTMLDADQPISAQEAVAVLIFGDSEIWRRIRAGTSKPKGLIAGLLYALWLLATGFPQLVAMLAREPGRRRDEVLAGPRKAAPAHLLAFGVDIEARERLLAEDRADSPLPGTAG
jgi:cellulose synthase (UDP-forming)